MFLFDQVPIPDSWRQLLLLGISTHHAGASFEFRTRRSSCRRGKGGLFLSGCAAEGLFSVPSRCCRSLISSRRTSRSLNSRAQESKSIQKRKKKSGKPWEVPSLLRPPASMCALIHSGGLCFLFFCVPLSPSRSTPTLPYPTFRVASGVQVLRRRALRRSARQGKTSCVGVPILHYPCLKGPTWAGEWVAPKHFSKLGAKEAENQPAGIVQRSAPRTSPVG